MSDNIIRRRKSVGYFFGPNAIFEDNGLSAYEKLIYLYLCRRADSEDRKSWPSIPTIAKECGVSVRTVQRTISSLQDKNLLTIVPRFVDNSAQSSNLYFIEDLENLDSTGVPESHRGGGATQAPGVVSESHRGGVTQSPKGNPIKDTHKKGMQDYNKKVQEDDDELDEYAHLYLS